MNGFPRRVAWLVTCVITLATPQFLAAQAKRPAAARPPAPAPRPQAAPARPRPPAPPRPQPAAPPKAPPAAARPEAAAPPVPAPPQTPADASAAANAAAKQADPDLAPAGYTYDPQGRRDPFVSLLRGGGSSGQRGGLGTRPPGLAGLETSEVTLRGTLLSQGAYVGIVQGSDNRTYIVKSGDKLLDGEIRSITPDTMVIMQQVTDPLSLEKQREVRKLLRPTTEEAK